MPPFHLTMYDWQDIGWMTLQLVVSVILGGVIGWEREVHGRAAGLRTHMLLCLGSTLFTLISIKMTQPPNDPARIAAQIVSGIGFIGAGAILRQGSEIRGLTSATSLWATAAIGMAVGIGNQFYIIAIFATILAFFTLSVINRWASQVTRVQTVRELDVTFSQNAELPTIFGELAKCGVNLVSFRQETSDVPGTMRFVLFVKPTARNSVENALQFLATRPDVTAAALIP